ncbi:hypothetical protein GUJ93_ZPchr0009g1036 [Zizania palustris]|uniref:BHLH domain-containing protein n=1 Tax=Zizania palustris TaxID=103762 RepID=A0A8J5RNC9_ZIZPA|nr:hypothetical protein GUJ93_ZPchr0009g1036 [Zizania palustris]
MAIGEALRRLCEEVGWSYAAFWKAIGAADPVHLVWEDGCCGHASCSARSDVSEAGYESGGSAVCTLVRKMMTSQVHVVGEGTIGRAAFTGNHQWIVHDTSNDHELRSEVAAEMNHQFTAGIKTIAIIPVLPRGVLQLGSTGVVMEDTNSVLQYKKLCCQLNNRSSMVASASVKNDLSQKVQSRSLQGLPSICPADSCSKVLSGSPATYEQCYSPDARILSSSTSANTGRNASFLKVAQRNGQGVREQILYAPDMRFRQQNPYHDRRVELNTLNAVSSGFVSSISTSVEKHPLLMTNIGQLEQGNIEESPDPRNVLLKSIACWNPVVHENTNTSLFPGVDKMSVFQNSRGSFDFLQAGPRVVEANLYNNSTSSQALDQRCSSSGMVEYKPYVSYKIPQSAQFIVRMENSRRQSFEASAAQPSGTDVQFSCGLKTATHQDNSDNNICQNQKANEVSESSAAVSVRDVKHMDQHKLPDISNERTSSFLMDPSTENDLFDIFGTEFHHLRHSLDGDISWNTAKPQNSDRDVLEPSIYLNSSPVFSAPNDEFSYSGIFSLADTDQLLDAVISNVNPCGKQISGDSASCKTSLTDVPSTSYCGSKEMKQCKSSGAPPLLIKNDKGLDTPNKANRKRSRPGEHPKPRPKDRQLIQDRIKELRELVPNGAKCSIDALLEKTIKHMLFLQSVTKHADDLKDSSESKMHGGENGPLLKDYFEGGATWAFDVGSQSMTCPIIVEDLDRPRQMLVEMLCEDRGIFLEIADFIKGLGLTILRGVMEARKNKIWARFTVEANRTVTRMEIFLSLMHLLEPGCDGGRAGENPNNVKIPPGVVQHPVIPATGQLR